MFKTLTQTPAINVGIADQISLQGAALFNSELSIKKNLSSLKYVKARIVPRKVYTIQICFKFVLYCANTIVHDSLGIEQSAEEWQYLK